MADTPILLCEDVSMCYIRCVSRPWNWYVTSPSFVFKSKVKTEKYKRFFGTAAINGKLITLAWAWCFRAEAKCCSVKQRDPKYVVIVCGLQLNLFTLSLRVP